MYTATPRNSWMGSSRRLQSGCRTGEEVNISSFGSFTVRDKGLRMGRNPKTGEPAAILPRRVVVFRASAKLKERINEMLGDAGEDA